MRADVPLYVLALQGPTGWWRFEHDSSGSDLVALVNQRVAFPGETLIIAVQGANRSFRSAFKRVSGALVLDRK